jgi:hypothetical protein
MKNTKDIDKFIETDIKRHVLHELHGTEKI